MRNATVLLLVLFVCACDLWQNAEIGVKFEEKSLSEILDMAGKLDKKVLIDFWADG